MHVTVTCPQCLRQLRLSREVLGSSVRCPLCQTVFLTRAAANESAEVVSLDPPTPRILDAQPAEDVPLAPLLHDDIPEAPLLPDEPADHRPGDRDSQRRDRRPRTQPDAPPPLQPPPGVPPFPTVPFTLEVSRDPDRRLKGRFQAEVRPGGLRLWRGAGRLLQVPVGGKAEYLGGARLSIDVEGRSVEFTIVEAEAPPAAVARSVCDYLSGQTEQVRLPRHNPWPLLCLALLPLGIPLLTIRFGHSMSGVIGVFFWGAFALALAGFCAFIACRGHGSAMGRRLSAVGVVGAGYLVLLCGFFFDSVLTPPTVGAALWRETAPPGGGYRVRMPAGAANGLKAMPGFKAAGLQLTEVQVRPQNALFVVGHADLEDGPGALSRSQCVFLVQQALMQKSGTKAVREREIALEGKTGREWIGQGPGSANSVLRIYTTDKRLYVALAACVREEDADAIPTFFDSFRFDAALEQPVPAGPPLFLPRGPGPIVPPDTNDFAPGGRLFDAGGKSFVWAGFTPDGRAILGAATDGTIRRWDAGSGRVESTIQVRPGAPVVCAALSPDGATLALGLNNGSMQLLTPPEARARRSVVFPGLGSLLCIAFSPDGKTVAVGHRDQVSLWDAKRSALRPVRLIDSTFPLSLTFSADNLLLAVGRSAEVTMLYEMPSGKLAATCEGNRAGVGLAPFAMRSLALSRDGRTVAAPDNVGTVRLWDARTGAVKHRLAHPDQVNEVAFHPAGRLLFTACSDGRIRVWNAIVGQVRQTFRLGIKGDLRNSARSLQVSPDGNRLAVVYGDRVERWDISVLIGPLLKTP